MRYVFVLMALLVSVNIVAKPKIRIIATGGTIAGVSTSATSTAYTAGQVGVQTLIDAVPQMLYIADVDGEQLVNIGSQDMNNEVWLKLAKRINQLLNEEGFDGASGGELVGDGHGAGGALAYGADAVYGQGGDEREDGDDHEDTQRAAPVDGVAEDVAEDGGSHHDAQQLNGDQRGTVKVVVGPQCQEFRAVITLHHQGTKEGGKEHDGLWFQFRHKLRCFPVSRIGRRNLLLFASSHLRQDDRRMRHHDRSNDTHFCHLVLRYFLVVLDRFDQIADRADAVVAGGDKLFRIPQFAAAEVFTAVRQRSDFPKRKL